MMFKSQIALRRPGPKYRIKDKHDLLGPERRGKLRRYTGPVLESLYSPCVGDPTLPSQIYKEDLIICQTLRIQI